MENSLSLSFTIDNGVARSADGSLLWILHPPPPSDAQRRHYLLQEQLEAQEAEFLDDDSSDDDYEYSVNIDELLDNDASDMDEEVTLTMMDHLGRGLTARDRQPGVHRRAGVEGAVFVPASDAAVAGLEKHAFHAMAKGRATAGAITGTGCAICLDNFQDGEEVTVMPCSGRGHEFHPECITKWLGKGNTCPLRRHALPTQTS